MLKVGLTGGYATGKSFVAGELHRLGCKIIYADKLGHSVLQPGGEAYLPVIETFGSEILTPDGTIDRKRLGAIVFASPVLLAKLNSIVHPAVFRLEEKLLVELASDNYASIAVIEAAILIETGRFRNFDRIILTTCSEEIQVARAIARDKLEREEVLVRLRNQMSNDKKKAYAHYVIDTGMPKEETTKRVEMVFHQLSGLQETKS